MSKRPSLWLSVPSLLFCLYVPFGWIAFSSRSWGPTVRRDWLVFLITLPGEWFAQRCGGRAEDYYFFAGLSTAGLLSIGVYASRKNWFIFAVSCLVLTGWAAFTANWLWHDLGPSP